MRRPNSCISVCSVRLEPDIAALGARIAKDLALAAAERDRSPLLSHAADLYEAIYRQSGGYYPAVNVATLRLLAGEREAAERAARDTIALCAGEEVHRKKPTTARHRKPRLRWSSATWTARARRSSVPRRRTPTSRRAQPRESSFVSYSRRSVSIRLCLRRSRRPMVIHYTGHMTAAPGVDGRFRADQEV